ncbi:LysR family transcriptional regulator [Leisingera sp. XS_AS12]|uniref:LysR family transcriptional regulator n=1 Tax=Leisingera sp. XS_AS12 TaxID=3241294 RepID=UPI003519CA11
MESAQRYREIGAFLGVATTLNFTKAAKRLAVSQPTLSRLVARLEDQLGTPLFHRSSRRVSLTSAGLALLREIEGVDGRINRALEIARKTAMGDHGEVRIAYNSLPINSDLPRRLREFQSEHPDVTLTLALQTSAAQLDNLAAGNIDLAFGSVATRRAIFESCLVSEHRIVAVLNSNDPLVSKPDLRPADLAARALILGNPDSWISFNPLVEAFLVRFGLDRNPVYRAEDFESICAMITVDFGIGFFIETPEAMMRRGLVTRPVQGLEATVPILLNWRKNLSNPSARRLIEFIQDG